MNLRLIVFSALLVLSSLVLFLNFSPHYVIAQENSGNDSALCPHPDGSEFSLQVERNFFSCTDFFPGAFESPCLNALEEEYEKKYGLKNITCENGDNFGHTLTCEFGCLATDRSAHRDIQYVNNVQACDSINYGTFLGSERACLDSCDRNGTNKGCMFKDPPLFSYEFDYGFYCCVVPNPLQADRDLIETEIDGQDRMCTRSIYAINQNNPVINSTTTDCEKECGVYSDAGEDFNCEVQTVDPLGVFTENIHLARCCTSESGSQQEPTRTPSPTEEEEEPTEIPTPTETPMQTETPSPTEEEEADLEIETELDCDDDTLIGMEDRCNELLADSDEYESDEYEYQDYQCDAVVTDTAICQFTSVNEDEDEAENGGDLNSPRDDEDGSEENLISPGGGGNGGGSGNPDGSGGGGDSGNAGDDQNTTEDNDEEALLTIDGDRESAETMFCMFLEEIRGEECPL